MNLPARVRENLRRAIRNPQAYGLTPEMVEAAIKALKEDKENPAASIMRRCGGFFARPKTGTPKEN